ncbi:MAG: excinuclease ABC subunit UvrC [Leptospiraceae bacterium]|nr:excinuclease ABC subunit UvrC [Leptospiraceae bacterium]MCB1302875.1 excinuclease ABC subunit UvrC [Leptospiraceae bacterium]
MATEQIAQKVARAPLDPGCYLWKDSAGEILYVGKADRLRNRLRNYLKPETIKTAFLMERAADLEWITTETSTDALILEDTLIKKHKPRFNVRLKDDKRFPYLCVSTSEPFPRIFLTRSVRKDGNRYFGPYTDVRAARHILDLIHKTFPIRKVRQKLPLPRPRRPCMNFHINRCLAPCQGNVPESEYKKIVDEIILFLEGKHELLEELVRKRMEEFSQAMDFERAAIYRDILASLRRFQERQSVSRPSAADEDVVAVARDDSYAQAVIFEYRNGNLTGRKAFPLTGIEASDEPEILQSFVREYYLASQAIPSKILVSHAIEEKSSLEDWLSKKTSRKIRIHQPSRGPNATVMEMVKKNAELLLKEQIIKVKSKDRSSGLAEIQHFLQLSAIPEIIECYDISHFQGRSTVASGVQFQNGEPRKAGYRRYVIRSVGGIDDPASMREVIARRLQRLLNEESALPDLIVIDGGTTQLQAACEAAAALGITELPMVGLAKKREEIYLPGESIPLTLDKNSAGMRILRHLRDEAHRFGITHQRIRSNRAQLKILEQEIPDVGLARIKAMLKHFEGRKIAEASLEELMEVPGIGEKLAAKIHAALHETKTPSASGSTE